MGKDNKPGSKGLGVGLTIGGRLVVAGIGAVGWALIAPANTHPEPTPVPSISTAPPSPQASASPAAKCGLDFCDM